jgi:hypothetical protein
MQVIELKASTIVVQDRRITDTQESPDPLYRYPPNYFTVSASRECYSSSERIEYACRRYLRVLAMAIGGIESEHSQRGMVVKHTTTCTEAMAMKIGLIPVWTSQSYPLQVRPKLKMFLKIIIHVKASMLRLPMGGGVGN